MSAACVRAFYNNIVTSVIREKRMFDWMLLTFSLIKIRKSSGPRIEPCGTPAKIEAQSDIIPFMTTLCLRPDR